MAAVVIAVASAVVSVASLFLRPSINQDVTGPRIDDLDVTVSTYGVPIPRVWGPENRVNGNIIWSTGLTETEHREKQSSGGKGGGGSSTSTSYTYAASVAIAVCRGPIRGIGRIWADSKVVADFRDDLTTMADPSYAWPFVSPPDSNSRYDSITIYNGNSTQMPNSTMEAEDGAGNVPGYRATAYIVIDNLQLADFGNRIPNLTFEVLADWSTTVGDAIGEICELAGLGGFYNTRGLTENLRGLKDDSIGEARSAMRGLISMFDVDISEIDGIIYFLPKDRFPFAFVPAKYLGAYEESGKTATQRMIHLANEIDLPNAVEVVHRDPARDYQANTQTAKRLTKRSDGTITVRSEIVMPGETARHKAENKLRRAWMTRRAFNFTLPVGYQQLVAGDSLVAQDRSGNEFTIRVTSAKKSGLLVDVEGTAHFIEFEHIQPVAATSVRSIVVVGATSVNSALMDIPPLRDADNDSGIYIAAGADSSAWRGASLLISTDSGATFNPVKTFPGNAITGVTSSGMFNGPTLYFDRNNFVDVTLDNTSFQLDSVTEEAVLNGANAIFINGEIIQFQTATLIGGTTYRLTNLLRGRRGTEWAMAPHSSGSAFVLLTGGAIERYTVDLGEKGLLRQYKVVPGGMDPADVTATNFTYQANSLKPLSPCHVRGSRNPSTFDWTVTWVRRTRLNGGWNDGADVPLGENSEKYDVEVYDGAVVKRSFLGLATPTFTYTSAEQVADFGANQSTIYIRVFQISDLAGRGQVRQETLTS
jgi:hypothetical protein